MPDDRAHAGPPSGLSTPGTNPHGAAKCHVPCTTKMLPGMYWRQDPGAQPKLFSDVLAGFRDMAEQESLRHHTRRAMYEFTRPKCCSPHVLLVAGFRSTAAILPPCTAGIQRHDQKAVPPPPTYWWESDVSTLKCTRHHTRRVRTRRVHRGGCPFEANMGPIHAYQEDADAPACCHFEANMRPKFWNLKRLRLHVDTPASPSGLPMPEHEPSRHPTRSPRSKHDNEHDTSWHHKRRAMSRSDSSEPWIQKTFCFLRKNQPHLKPLAMPSGTRRTH